MYLTQIHHPGMYTYGSVTYKKGEGICKTVCIGSPMPLEKVCLDFAGSQHIFFNICTNSAVDRHFINREPLPIQFTSSHSLTPSCTIKKTRLNSIYTPLDSPKSLTHSVCQQTPVKSVGLFLLVSVYLHRSGSQAPQ